jgi:hypothetical protein
MFIALRSASITASKSSLTTVYWCERWLCFYTLHIFRSLFISHTHNDTHRRSRSHSTSCSTSPGDPPRQRYPNRSIDPSILIAAFVNRNNTNEQNSRRCHRHRHRRIIVVTRCIRLRHSRPASSRNSTPFATPIQQRLQWTLIATLRLVRTHRHRRRCRAPLHRAATARRRRRLAAVAHHRRRPV